jgi:hypothetical protein
VADDVVQLGRDPGALVPQRQVGEQLAFLLQLAAALRQLLRRFPALAQHRAGEIARHAEHRHRHLAAAEDLEEDHEVRDQAARDDPGGAPGPAQRGGRRQQRHDRQRDVREPGVLAEQRRRQPERAACHGHQPRP